MKEKSYIWRIIKGSGKLKDVLVRESRGAYSSKKSAKEVGSIRLKEFPRGKGYKLKIVEVTANTKFDF